MGLKTFFVEARSKRSNSTRPCVINNDVVRRILKKETGKACALASIFDRVSKSGNTGNSSEL